MEIRKDQLTCGVIWTAKVGGELILLCNKPDNRIKPQPTTKADITYKPVESLK